jgi:hypothetical protein
MKNQETKYLGWPKNFRVQPISEWLEQTKFKRVPLGTGLLGSEIGFPDIWPITAPHPELVKEWRKSNNATVSETAAYFGLIDSQVLEATGRS